jgi:hypothetical protein
VILEAGTFRVSDYRKPIPARVKIQALLNWICLRVDPPNPQGGPVHILAPVVPSWNADDLEFDHRPALVQRPYDTEASDFIPPQHDPKHIEPVLNVNHDERTFGRKAGASKTVTTRGSDVGEAARTRDIRASDAVHRAAMASKAGHFEAAAAILSSVKKPRRPKKKIPSRPFPKGQRPLRSRPWPRSQATT